MIDDHLSNKGLSYSSYIRKGEAYLNFRMTSQDPCNSDGTKIYVKHGSDIDI